VSASHAKSGCFQHQPNANNAAGNSRSFKYSFAEGKQHEAAITKGYAKRGRTKKASQHPNSHGGVILKELMQRRSVAKQHLPPALELSGKITIIFY